MDGSPSTVTSTSPTSRPGADLAGHLSTRYGRLDALVNNAGIAFRFGLMETTAADFERVFAVNLEGPFLGIKALAPLMRDSGGGAVVNIGSAAGMTGHFSAAYSSSKWGLRGLSKVAAMEFAPWRIRVNAVHPGIVNTALVPGDTRFPDAMLAHTPAGWVSEPAEVAGVVVFLCSPAAAYITGRRHTGRRRPRRPRPVLLSHQSVSRKRPDFFVRPPRPRSPTQYEGEK